MGDESGNERGERDSEEEGDCREWRIENRSEQNGKGIKRS